MVLEKDVLDIEPFVSFHPQNFNCFSNEFIKLYQIICSEIDVICKEFCQYINYKKASKEKYSNIIDYARIILADHSELAAQKICVSGDVEFTLAPWIEWSANSNDNSPNASPQWWRQYNAIKHKRTGKDVNDKYNYQYANLENVINALAALCIIEKYFYADLAKDQAPLGITPNILLTPYSKLFGFIEFEHRYLALTEI